MDGLLCDACINNNAVEVLPSYPANFILSTPNGDVGASIVDGVVRQAKGIRAKITESCGLYLSQAGFGGEIHVRLSSIPGKETNAGATIYLGKNDSNPCGAVTSGGIYLSFLGSYENSGDFQTTLKVNCSDLGAFSGECPVISESDVFVCTKCDSGQTVDSNCALKVNEIGTKLRDIGLGLFGRTVQRRLYAVGQGHCPSVASDAVVATCPVPGFPADLL